MSRWLFLVALVLAPLSCGKDASERPRGLPPRGQVQLPAPAVGQTFGKTRATPARRATADDPHAGLDIANDPRAGMFAGDDPHGGADDDPHGAGAEPAPGKTIKGTLALADGLDVEVAAGDAVFVGVARVSDGKTLALARLDVTELPMPFEISGETAIFTGAGFDGEVTVLARLDRDGEARTRKPGDVEGRATVTIPADGVQLTLDEPVE